MTITNGKTVFAVKISDESLAILRGELNDYQTGLRKGVEAQAKGRAEVNNLATDTAGLFYETGRKVVDAAINVAPDALNLVLFPDFSTHTKDEPSFGRAKVGEMYDELSSQIDPNYAGNPLPRIETSAVKYDFQSEMMRRDINGKLDGDGTKAGDAITTTTSIVAPLVVGGAIFTARGSVEPKSLADLNGLPKGFGDFQVRNWYVPKSRALNTNVPFTETNARALHAQRNALKIEARDMMINRKLAADLQITDPIRPFEYYVDKYTKQGYTGEALWVKIITGSAKPNANVNKMLGIE